MAIKCTMKLIPEILKPLCWKAKATQRSIKLKLANKRIKELEKSRNLLKQKLDKQLLVNEGQNKKIIEIEAELKKN
jgi:hypothetical protein